MKKRNRFHRLKRHKKLLLNCANFSCYENACLKKNVSFDIVKLIIELCTNLKNNNFTIHPSDQLTLEKYKKKMQFMINNQNSLCRRKECIQKGGGFLSAILGIAGTTLINQLLSNDGKKV